MKKRRNYSETMKDVIMFTNLMEVTIREINKAIQTSNDKLSLIDLNFQVLEASLKNSALQAERLCSEEENKRNVIARNAIKHIKKELSNIKDPHYHRMATQYINSCGTASYISNTDTPTSIIKKLNESINEIDELISCLNHAFIPPAASNIIGSVARFYRKSNYTAIIKLRDAILFYAKTLVDFNDTFDIKRECSSVLSKRLDNERSTRSKQLEIISEEMKNNVSRLNTLFLQGIKMIRNETNIFKINELSINLGECCFRDSNAFILSEAGFTTENYVNIYDDKVIFPVNVDVIKENIFFIYENRKNLSSTLCSLATDILYTNDLAEVILIDINGLGNTYRMLQPLNDYERVSIWNTDVLVEKGLELLEEWITNTYVTCLGDRYSSIDEHNKLSLIKRKYKYLIIDDVLKNINQKYLDKLLRIIENGANVGVYVLCSMESKSYENNRLKVECLSNMQKSMKVFLVDNDAVRINDKVQLTLKSKPNKERIAFIRNKLETEAEKLSVISIGPSLPVNGNWQKKSSAQCIDINFGIDENGKKTSFEISSDKPYGLIIGDVRVGKSSLLHTIVFQLLANYSPEEVRIAIGDFKDGADFNVYAKGNLKSVDLVVNDEDPDAMLSFLKFYVNEMQFRQRQFSHLEDITGNIVQKYEDFRKIYDKNNDTVQCMPRIILLIDEFQSLFDGTTCSAYMTELVRKGATYGIHVILSSQRAISDNPRNGFSSSLKDYFTSRFVFKTPQNVARSMLSERCADTGKENSGIQKAALLKKGQTLYNSYMGQNESGNSIVQCYYASPEMISTFIQIISSLNGEGNSVLLKKNSKSDSQPKGLNGILKLGKSIAFHKDSNYVNIDTIHDDLEVSINPQRIKNMILSGSDERILSSVVASIMTWRETETSLNTQLHFFGETDSIYMVGNNKLRIFYHKSIEDLLVELERQTCKEHSEYIINIFIQPDRYSELTQSVASTRNNSGVEAMKKVFEQRTLKNSFSIIFAKSFKSIRNSMPYVLGLAPLHLTAVGDMENLKYSMSDTVQLTSGDFDIPNLNAIKAYYYNKDTEKFGKVILFKP